MNIHQLNVDYSLADQLTFREGTGSLPFIEVNHNKASALISVYAGQVLSYLPAGETDDVMFLSKEAYYQTGKAIKGGVPICWPWFGADPENLGRAAHGFVRNRPWAVLETGIAPAGEVRVVLGLVDTEETKKIWPYAFSLSLEVTVGDSLTIELTTRNSGRKSFPVTQALHTYFNVGDISQVKVLGLDGLDYLDKVDNFMQKTQQGPISIADEVDRIYTGVHDDLVIDDAVLARQIRISTRCSKTAVVWNPWAKICTEMTDLNNEDYLRFLCVETANAADDVVEILPDSEHRLYAKYCVTRN